MRPLVAAVVSAAAVTTLVVGPRLDVGGQPTAGRPLSEPDGAGDRPPSVVDPAPTALVEPGNGVAWETPQVTLGATDLRIEVDGVVFTGGDGASQLAVHSDPGDERYQTLEVTWIEHGVGMRWYLYLASDGVDWWVSEMRIYDGSVSGEWIRFPGERFRTPLGEAFSGDLRLDLADNEGWDGTARTDVSGSLTAEGLRIEAFKPSS